MIHRYTKAYIAMLFVPVSSGDFGAPYRSVSADSGG
jgi:hypothetical protein